MSVANSLFRGERDLLILCIDESELGSKLIWEAPIHPDSSAAPPGTDGSLFPHVYGPIEAAAVKKVLDLAEGDSGFELPAAIK